MHRRRRRRELEGISYWQSYSDMMAALLLVFVLIITFTVFQAKASDEQSQKTIQEQQQQINAITGIRGKLVAELNREFKNSNLQITVDKKTGAISFDSSVLFDYDQYKLTKKGKQFLNEFFPKYFDVILQEDVKGYVSEVIIEGHTDQHGSYLYNLDLSQKRAYAVAEYCLQDHNSMFDAEELKELRQMVTANGRSYNGLVRDDNGKINQAASRRVEVKFRLKEEEMINQISELLED